MLHLGPQFIPQTLICCLAHAKVSFREGCELINNENATAHVNVPGQFESNTLNPDRGCPCERGDCVHLKYSNLVEVGLAATG